MPDMRAILWRHASGHMAANLWTDAPLGFMKWLSTTAIGITGEDSVHDLCGETGLVSDLPMNATGERDRMLPWDIRIEGRTLRNQDSDPGHRQKFPVQQHPNPRNV